MQRLITVSALTAVLSIAGCKAPSDSANESTVQAKHELKLKDEAPMSTSSPSDLAIHAAEAEVSLERLSGEWCFPAGRLVNKIVISPEQGYQEYALNAQQVGSNRWIETGYSSCSPSQIQFVNHRNEGGERYMGLSCKGQVRISVRSGSSGIQWHASGGAATPLTGNCAKYN